MAEDAKEEQRTNGGGTEGLVTSTEDDGQVAQEASEGQAEDGGGPNPLVSSIEEGGQVAQGVREENRGSDQTTEGLDTSMGVEEQAGYSSGSEWQIHVDHWWTEELDTAIDDEQKTESVQEEQTDNDQRPKKLLFAVEDTEAVRDDWRPLISLSLEVLEEFGDASEDHTQHVKDSEEFVTTAEEQEAAKDWKTEGDDEVQIENSLDFRIEMLERTSITLSKYKSESVSVDVNVEETKTRILIRYLCNQVQQLREPQINKLTLYIYGSEDAVLKECERARNMDTFIFHPYNATRTYYVLFKLVLTVLNLIFTPLGITFFDKDQGIKTIGWRFFSFGSDMFFLVDILINFRMGIYTDDREVVILNPKAIAKNYIKSWLLPDFLAAFPLDFLLYLIKVSGFHKFRSYTFSKFLRLFYFGRIISLIRLLCVSNTMRRFKEWELATNVNLEPMELLLRTLSVCFIMLIVCHWNGCLQFFIPMMQKFPEHSWVVKANLTEAWWADQYSAGVLRAISHTLANSYGPGGLPTELSEVAYTVISMISGALMHTLIVGNVAAMVLNADAPGRMYREKLCQVEEYMENRRLPRKLRLKVANYYKERYHGKWFNQEEIIAELSEFLKEDVLSFLCRNLVNNVPLFQNADPNFLKAVITNLQYEVFQKNDMIIREGATAERMFFIESGIVSVETAFYQKLLSDGAYFGEICLLTKGYRKASVRAVTLCKMYSLSAGKFNDLLKQFPGARAKIIKMAAQRQRTLKRAVEQWKP
ncbi:potassium/sodium hyperpolarization-activated cyclic nucleotide-gated channel 1-like isoform X1 [Leucoraja erinacea]|uniref:potassium/sodium hyperpolarization-activated cyclic nucleotide-gated channel 1-like isoform X1 n=1 Tax=Leucoraja erinaceus TaxID=7782 RepID=UPI002455C508|nr:potassium/sodium hyperpolarization-activated cyclic nucleotide-gated channel 1-like isoform X1 [Leucoraja erinacea]